MLCGIITVLFYLEYSAKGVFTLKKFCLLFITLLSVTLLFSCSGTDKNKPEKDSYTIEIEIEEYGTITALLDAKSAPITVKNFIDNVNDGFYNGLTFHRIMKGFMMQGGDKNGDGFNNEGTPEIKGEFLLNGVKNDLSHTRGTLSMARANGYDTASTQFFIVQQDSLHLDGQYAAFGKVISGMEIVDDICNNTVVIGNNGYVPEENRPVIKEIRVVE